MSNSKYENACAFARTAVRDMLNAVTTHSSVTRLRLTGEKHPYQFVWIMLDRVSAPTGENGTTSESGEQYIWAHTNDADFMVGYPPSLCISEPFSRAAELQEQIMAFLEKEIAHYGKVEALMQSEAEDRSHRPNYVGDSESGYEAARVMGNHDVL
jgi:hypothetical protein